MALAGGILLAGAVLCWVGLRLPVRIAAAAVVLGLCAFGGPAVARQARFRTEAPVLENMALIAVKEEVFRARAMRDLDGDARGEYGSLYDLSRTRPPLVHENLGVAEEYGYRFYVVLGQMVNESESSFYAYAVPRHYGVTGRRAMYVDETGVVRIGDAGPTPVITRELGRSLTPVDLTGAP